MLDTEQQQQSTCSLQPDRAAVPKAPEQADAEATPPPGVKSMTLTNNRRNAEESGCMPRRPLAQGVDQKCDVDQKKRRKKRALELS